MTTTHVLETPEVDIAYDVHGPLPTADGRPPLVMIGQPMDASGFRALASYLPDRVVVTYDPRGLGRSTRRDGDVRSSPVVQAEDVHAVIEALGCARESYTLASLRYDLSKLRAKGLVAKLPNSRRYQLLPQGYSICLVFLKLFERVYAPLTAGLLSPVKSDARLDAQKRSQLDRLYQRVIDDLDTLVQAVGLKAA